MRRFTQPTEYERRKIRALAQQRADRFGGSYAAALAREYEIWLDDAAQPEENSDAVQPRQI